MYQKILVAVDGSESSRRALSEALKVAKLAHGEVRAVYVVDKSPVFFYGGYYDSVALLAGLRADGRTTLEEAMKAMRSEGVAGEVQAVENERLSDDVPHCLQRYAEQYGADLVVMGTHGRRGVRRVVLGSVAERFLRFATCPVLLVRGEV